MKYLKNKLKLHYSKILILFAVFILIIYICIPIFAETVKLLKSETLYIILDSKGKPLSIKISVAIKWFINKSVSFINKLGITNFLIEFGKEKIVQNESKVDLYFTEDNYALFYAEPPVNKIALPLNFSIRYFFNGKETTPSKIIGKTGELEIQIKVVNNAYVREKFEYKKFPDDNSITREETDVLLPYIALINTDIPLNMYDEIEVPSGIKTLVGENYSIIIPIFPYPNAECLIKIKGTIKSLPNIYIRSSLITFEIPNYINQNITQTNAVIIDNYKNYLTIKQYLIEIINLETQVIDQIDLFKNELNNILPQILAAQDLINFYVGNLEKVMKINDLFYSIIYDLKDHLGFDDGSLIYLKEFTEINKSLIKIILSGAYAENQYIPGLYNFPELIEGGQTTAEIVKDALQKFRTGTERIRTILSQVKVTLDNYEMKTIELINLLRKEEIKYKQLISIANSYSKDYSIILDRSSLPKDTIIDQSYNFSYFIDFSEE